MKTARQVIFHNNNNNDEGLLKIHVIAQSEIIPYLQLKKIEKKTYFTNYMWFPFSSVYLPLF